MGRSMKNPVVRQLSFVALGMLLSLATLADDQIRKKYSDDELIKILKEDGFRAVELSDDRVIKLKVDGQSYVLYVYDDDDLQMYYGLTGYSVTAGNMNTWNRTRRASRAYLDHDNDPILESDLLANAGFAPEQFTKWVSVFLSSSQSFRQFLSENDKDENRMDSADSAVANTD